MNSLFDISGLRIDLDAHGDRLSPVGPVDLTLAKDECLGIVGESGSGKSLTLKALLGLLPDGLSMGAGQIRIEKGGDLVACQPERLRGHRVGLISQEPGAALDPLMRVGGLIAEVVQRHAGCSRTEAAARAVDLMRQVGIPDPERRARFWPHELSGGLKQRIVIAMALACDSDILLCDEPTTALDVTIQAQIIRLLRDLRDKRSLSLIFVTHDLALIHEIADRVAVMYAGLIVETGPTEAVFADPRHPYTRALLAAIPDMDSPDADLQPIAGAPPAATEFGEGCRFAPRCRMSSAACVAGQPELEPTGAGTQVACVNWRRSEKDAP
ncbi:peptide/nickel transport system ATP-binding protein/oligopeptide transport system ATP-binding protein [Cribrihabitans marinus]|uniref:Peptide/nickel transport system ATP-binding protein/oligopeptide transport system ATP-binding protein n=1 Tax=Cribrihabitans marinus TaxID=1227549 RepID=A0A1H7DUU4_9RHOB|nr:ABC transporter ATP-binding protein [Cribrihabitans marinus]GGH39991.1 peptide ABC transporter ATP-binding protein [Cribrihabitans marinus]SEK04607.1 peptide/nickel transport system ATP-binding protein/oligopeptide transport system ATP-binding protein [Cribrihabitans marinus]